MIDRRSFTRSGTILTGSLWLGSGHSRVIAQQHAPSFDASLLRVGLDKKIRTIAQAARMATPGSVVEVDAGDYFADVAVWNVDGVKLRAAGGRVRLVAQGASAEGKAIWVVRARGMRIEGFDFEGATVPDRNGAGIRLESGSLHVQDCRFLNNEMGLLTGNDPNTVLTVENCEFAYNQRPDGHNHNLYVGRIARLSVVGSYFHHARIGHLLKSRAAVSHIYCNRLTDEAGGTASYELEFPDGGIAYVIGNIVAQNLQTDNEHLISFGAEGYKWPRNEIYLVNNTLVDPLPRGGVFLRVASAADAILAVNNLLLGSSLLESAGAGDYRSNFKADARDFAQVLTHDYRLIPRSRLAGRATDPGQANGQALNQQREYVHPRASRPLDDALHNPGAMQRLAPRTS